MKKQKSRIPKGSIPKSEDDPIDIPNEFENNSHSEIPTEEWPELSSLGPLEDMISEGWTPRVKTMPRTGSKVICLRRVMRDTEGKRHDQERGLGTYSDERWAELLSHYPKLQVPAKIMKESKDARPSSILSTTIGKPEPLTSSPIRLNLETLQWYTWAHGTAGYPGTLEQFVNDCVDGYFREHHKMEIAVIVPSD